MTGIVAPLHLETVYKRTTDVENLSPPKKNGSGISIFTIRIGKRLNIKTECVKRDPRESTWAVRSLSDLRRTRKTGNGRMGDKV